MTQEVNVNNVIHEFPDEATPEQIQNILHKETVNQKILNLTNDNFIDRPVERFGQDAWSAIKGLGNTVSQGVPSLLNQLVNRPGRAIENVTAGIGGIPFNIANSAMNIPQWLAHLESNRLSNTIKQYTPQIPVEEYQNKFVGGEPTQTDINIRNLAGNLPILLPLSRSAGKGTIGATKFAIGKVIGKENPELNLKAKILEDEAYKAYEDKLLAEQEHTKQEEAYQKARDEAKRLVNMRDVEAMEYKLNKHDQDMEQAKAKSDELKKNLEEIPPPPEAPKTFVEKNILPPEIKELKPPESPSPLDNQYEIKLQNALSEQEKTEQGIQSSKEHHENVKNLADQAENNIAEHLNIGSAHDVYVGDYLANRFLEREKALKEDYKNWVNKIRDKKVQMLPAEENSSALDMDKILEEVKKGNVKVNAKTARGIIQNPVLDSILKEAPTSADTDAATFLTKLKDFRTARFNASQRMRITDSASERENISKALKETKPLEEQALKALENGINKDNFNEFLKLNKRYVDYYDLADNPAMRHAIDYRRIEGNMIRKFRGPESGYSQIRELIKENPEIVKHVVGQSYESNPSSINKPDELTKEYTDQLPNLNRLIEAKNSSNNLLNEAKYNIEKAKLSHSKAKQAYTRAINEGVRARKAQAQKVGEYKGKLREYKQEVIAQTQAQKKYEADLKNYEKEKENYHKNVELHANKTKEHADKVASAEKIITDQQKKIEKMMQDARDLEENIKTVGREKSKREITLKKKTQLEMRYKKLQKDFKDANKNADNASTGLMHMYRVMKGLYRLSKKIKGF